MKGKINELGYLEIKRAGKFKVQVCKGSTHTTENAWRQMVNVRASCGDDCPHFGEPESNSGAPATLSGVNKSYPVHLKTCNRTLTFDEFEDCRGKADG